MLLDLAHGSRICLPRLPWCAYSSHLKVRFYRVYKKNSCLQRRLGLLNNSAITDCASKDTVQKIPHGMAPTKCKQHFVLRTTSSNSLMKKQVSSPFIVFVPVIPNGITHDFVVLTNKKARTAFSPFGLLIVELAGIEPATSSMPWKRATNCAIAPKATSYLSQACSVGTK